MEQAQETTILGELARLQAMVDQLRLMHDDPTEDIVEAEEIQQETIAEVPPARDEASTIEEDTAEHMVEDAPVVETVHISAAPLPAHPSLHTHRTGLRRGRA